MRKKIGTLIRDAREKQNLTRERAARRIGISPGYLGHLERDAPVRLSDKLVQKLILKLRVPRRILALQPAHNRRSSLWYARYRAKAS